MSKFNLQIDGKNKSTTEGNSDWWYGGGEDAWQSLQDAKNGVPLAIRKGKTVGVLEDGKVVEYIWHPEDLTNDGLVVKNQISESYGYFQLQTNSINRKQIASENVLNFLNGNGVAITYEANGGVRIANTITNNNQLTNGAGYVTSSGNTIIGTSDDVSTTGSQIIGSLIMTDGVITAHTVRTLTLGNLGYTGDLNANRITNNNQITNGAGYVTSSGNTVVGTSSDIITPSAKVIDKISLSSGVITSFTLRDLTLSDLGFTGDSNANRITNNNQITNGRGFVTSSGNTIIGTDSDISNTGSQIIGSLIMTDGVITAHTVRDLTLADIGFTGDANANRITNNNQITNGAGYITSFTNTQLTKEQVEDYVGGMVTGNTETNISVTYNDTTGKLNFVSVNTQLSNAQVLAITNPLYAKLSGGNTFSGNQTFSGIAQSNEYLKVFNNDYDAYFLVKNRTDGNQKMGFKSQTSGDMTIHTNDTERIRIDGTNGNANFSGRVEANGIIWAKSTNSYGLSIERNLADNSNTSIRFLQKDYTSYLGVDSDGSFAFGISPNLAISLFSVNRNGNATFSGSVNMKYGSGITGTGEGSNNFSVLQFNESNGTTRQGYIGFGSVGFSDLFIRNDLTNKSLVLNKDGVLTYDGNATFSGVVNMKYGSGITGTSSGSNNLAFLQFNESNGTTRQGLIGFGSVGFSDLFIRNDLTNKSLALNKDGVLTYDGNATFSGDVDAKKGIFTNTNPQTTDFVPYLEINQKGTVGSSKSGISFRNPQYNWDMGKISTERNTTSNSFDMVFYTSRSGNDSEAMRLGYQGNAIFSGDVEVEGKALLGNNWGIRGTNTGDANDCYFSFYENDGSTQNGLIGFPNTLASDFWIKNTLSGGVIKLKENGELYYNGDIQAQGYKSADGSSGVSGTFVNAQGDTVTVKNGLITNIFGA